MVLCRSDSTGKWLGKKGRRTDHLKTSVELGGVNHCWLCCGIVFQSDFFNFAGLGVVP
jgi:hypothetical protein